MIRLSVDVEMDQTRLKYKQILAYKKAQFALDSQVLKDSNYFIPKREGFLEKSGILHSRIGRGHIEWRTPYSRRLYYNPQYNFSKDVNPNARGLWYEEAKARNKNEWVEVIKNVYKEFFNGR